jgi:hypothetical protein
MFERPGEHPVAERTSIAGQASVLAKAALYSFELSKLRFIETLFGKDTMYRLTKEQMFVESLILATESRGVKLPALTMLIKTMKELSPNDLGRGRDEIVKILSPVPVMATLGTAYAEEGPGFWSRLIGRITGKGSGEEK